MTYKTTKFINSLLGIIVAGQFALILIANVTGFTQPLPDPSTGEAQPPPRSPGQCLQYAAERYCEATGQFQGWGMFESGSMKNDVFFRIGHDRIGINRAAWGGTTPIRNYLWPQYHNRRFVFESSILGIDLISDTISYATLPEELRRDVIINHAVYDRIFTMYYHVENLQGTYIEAPDTFLTLNVAASARQHPAIKQRLKNWSRTAACWRPAPPPGFLRVALPTKQHQTPKDPVEWIPE